MKIQLYVDIHIYVIRAYILSSSICAVVVVLFCLHVALNVYGDDIGRFICCCYCISQFFLVFFLVGPRYVYIRTLYIYRIYLQYARAKIDRTKSKSSCFF